MPSFDVVSRVDMQEMDNAVNQVKKEISTRFDFRGSKTQIDLDRKDGKISVLTEDDMKLRAIKDMLIAKVVRRSIEAEALVFGDQREGRRRHGAADRDHHQRHRYRDGPQGGQGGQGRQAQGAGGHPGRRSAHHGQAEGRSAGRHPARSRRPTWGCLCSSSTSASDSAAPIAHVRPTSRAPRPRPLLRGRSPGGHPRVAGGPGRGGDR